MQLKFEIYSPNSQPFIENSLMALFQQIFLIQAIGPTGNSLTFNGPAWSISVEFFTYLMFGVITLLFHKNKVSFFLILSLIPLLMLGTQSTFGFSKLVGCLAGFFIGCLTANTTEKLSIIIPNYVSLFIFLIILIFLQIKTPHEYDLTIYLLASALIASIVLSKKGRLKKFLNLKILTWLGSISYAVYMSHSAVIWVINQFFRVVMKRPEIIVNSQSTPQLDKAETFIAWILVVTLVLVLSKFVFYFIEKPMREKSRLIAFSKLN